MGKCKMKKILTAALLSTLVLSACGGGSSSNATASTDATTADMTAAIAPKTTSISPLPPTPDSQAVKASISGVDANSNGVRDDIEISLAKASVHDGGTATSSDFARLMDVIKTIQPSESTKVIDVKKFYCDYQTLPSSIKQKINSSMMLALVTDTSARKRAFAEQSINTSGSLGAETC